MSHDQRADDLLARMMGMPPKKNAEFVGKSVRIPRVKGRAHDKTKPKGFKHTIPQDSLLARIEKAVPWFRPEWREEMVQDLALAITSGEVDESVLMDMEAMRKYRNRAIAMFPDGRKYVSIEQAVEERGDKAKLLSLLADGEAYSLD